jgi:hypothetical protein
MSASIVKVTSMATPLFVGRLIAVLIVAAALLSGCDPPQPGVVQGPPAPPSPPVPVPPAPPGQAVALGPGPAEIDGLPGPSQPVLEQSAIAADIRQQHQDQMAQAFADVERKGMAEAQSLPKIVADDTLPGEWKVLEGTGFRIKLPPGMSIGREDPLQRGEILSCEINGSTPDRVNLRVDVEINPRNKDQMNPVLVILGGARTEQKLPYEYLWVNGFLMSRQTRMHTQQSAFGNKTVHLRVTEYQHREGPLTITLGINTPAEGDEAVHEDAARYLTTIQRVPD